MADTEFKRESLALATLHQTAKGKTEKVAALVLACRVLLENSEVAAVVGALLECVHYEFEDMMGDIDLAMGERCGVSL